MWLYHALILTRKRRRVRTTALPAPDENRKPLVSSAAAGRRGSADASPDVLVVQEEPQVPFFDISSVISEKTPDFLRLGRFSLTVGLHENFLDLKFLMRKKYLCPMKGAC